MTVKEIFDLRRQGRVEEAYDAIRPMYAVHKGRYTTLCMYWTAIDILKKRLDEGRLDEADKIYMALERMLPRVEALEQELDRQQTAPQQPAKQATPPLPDPQQNESPQRLPLPWEQGAIDTNDASSPTSAAAAALQSAARRLEEATQTPQGARENGCGNVVRPASLTSEPTDTPPDIPSEPRRSDRNSVPSVESVCQKEDPSVSEEEDSSNSPNSPLKEEKPSKEELPVLSVRENDEEKSVSSVESVCQDEGIIRPIEGLNAMQRVVLACVVGHPGYSVPKISESTGIPQNSIERHVAVLIDRGLIEPRKGELNSAEYYPT